ncbi:hypothetical protein [Paenibacillus sp. MBLB4367]|uniref:hypothetical protein n=1 Tax=Paenibacillus sp. MBLB4367 TaxID=3384767 RepID=UPI0039082FD5
MEWYTDARQLEIPLDAFAPSAVSFTYGDLFPTMRYEDGKPYRKQVYTKQEIYGMIDKFGLPQEWNQNGQYGPERYIEVQIWDDKPISAYLKSGGVKA